MKRQLIFISLIICFSCSEDKGVEVSKLRSHIFSESSKFTQVVEKEDLKLKLTYVPKIERHGSLPKDQKKMFLAADNDKELRFQLEIHSKDNLDPLQKHSPDYQTFDQHLMKASFRFNENLHLFTDELINAQFAHLVYHQGLSNNLKWIVSFPQPKETNPLKRVLFDDPIFNTGITEFPIDQQLIEETIKLKL